MKTIVRRIEEPEHVPADILAEAAGILRHGGLVAFPTETVYGLGGNALDEAAAKKIYAAKGRPSDNPLIAHIADRASLSDLVLEIPECAEKLMDAFWPGPLTLIFKCGGKVPPGTTGGLDTVGVRMPSDPIARQLIQAAGVPVAAPSANTSGRPSPTDASHVIEDLMGKVELIIDGGDTGLGLESTIVDVTAKTPTILRPGCVTYEMLAEVLGDVQMDKAILKPLEAGVKPKAPGMKYKHYAPKAELVIVQGKAGPAAARINELVQQQLQKGLKVGIIGTDETKALYPAGEFQSIGLREDESTIAHNLYRVLRNFDKIGVDFIYSEGFSSHQLGQAIMNRLSKAAGYHIEHV